MIFPRPTQETHTAAHDRTDELIDKFLGPATGDQVVEEMRDQLLGAAAWLMLLMRVSLTAGEAPPLRIIAALNGCLYVVDLLAESEALEAQLQEAVGR